MVPSCALNFLWLTQVGWVAGPACILLFFLVQLVSSRVLAMCYAVDGQEFARFHHAVRYILGRRDGLLLGACQMVNLVLVCIAYIITGGISLSSIAKHICHMNGTENCFSSQWKLTLIFGAAEVAMSQVPSLADAAWVSVVGASTSLLYSLMALILGAVYGECAVVAGDGGGSVVGISASPSTKAFEVMNSLGAIAFAFSFSLILLEIQDTLRQPPAAAITMKKAINIAVPAAFVLYLSVAVVCYAALGDNVPGMVLSGFPQAPDWTMLLTLFALVVSMLASFQLFCQPVFDTIEGHIKAWQLRRAGLLPRSRDVEMARPAAASTGCKAGISQAEQPRDQLVHNTAPHVVLTEVGAAATTLKPRPPRHHVHASSAHPPSPAAVLPASPFDQAAGAAAARPAQGASAANSLAKSQAGAGSEEPGNGLIRTLSSARAAVSIYSASSGLGNEDMPPNETCLLPFRQRLLVRTVYVGAVTLVATVLPFFSDIVGLVGGLTYFPLSIYFPYKMYTAVYRPQGLRRAAMMAVGALMLMVAIAATIGAVHGIAQNASSYEFFS
ncbi:hypothetical protein COHA_008128 [Chlorella ohadii]|uniref:Amino acid transporter transmembrane domain-containing protein n=1 Tax=Chlorella ohadii TaxID=2649997 RepID=A0AAD5DKH2_9CHLO|nr:hypothetical protein COHA_008128 [Chlorella ohadii]